MSNETLKAYDGYKFNPKVTGPKPTANDFEAAHKLGARVGTKVAVALAMYLRKGGATSNQVTAVCDGPQLNKMRGLVASGNAKRVNLPRENGHTVYKLEFAKPVEPAARKAADKPTKGKAAAKPKGKPKATSKARSKAAKPAEAAPATA